MRRAASRLAGISKMGAGTTQGKKYDYSRKK